MRSGFLICEANPIPSHPWMLSWSVEWNRGLNGAGNRSWKERRVGSFGGALSDYLLLYGCYLLYIHVLYRTYAGT